jgi:hypothetical protein
MSLLVADKLILQAMPNRAGSGSNCGGDLDEVRRDGAIEPRRHGAIHATLVRINNDDGGDIIDDMIGELILAEGVEEEGVPLIVVRWVTVKDDGDECLAVKDGDRST